MKINIVPAEDVRSGKSGGNKGPRYSKYSISLKPILGDLKKEIEKNNVIRILTRDLAAEMGKEYMKLNDTSLHWGVKYALFDEGIVVDTGTHKTGGKVLLMRKREEKDVLPASLAKSKAVELPEIHKNETDMGDGNVSEVGSMDDLVGSGDIEE